MFTPIFKKRSPTGNDGVIDINGDPLPQFPPDSPHVETRNDISTTTTTTPSITLTEATQPTTSVNVVSESPSKPSEKDKKKHKKEKRHKKDRQGASWSIWGILWGTKTPTKRNPERSPSMSSMNRHQTVTVKMDGSTTWISCMMLCLWDNIFGPRVEQVWEGTETIPLDTLRSMGRHALSGELGDNELQIESDPESKLHMFTDYIVVGLLFTAPLDTPTLTRLGLLLVVKKEYMHRILVIYSTIVSQMCRLVYKLRALLLRPNKISVSDSLEAFSPHIGPSVMRLEEVFYSSLSSHTFPSSIFCLRKVVFNLDFLTRVITSHLQTHGCTVVVGSNLEVVNMFIDTLSLFLTSKEKERSSLAYEGRTYVPDLVLQGVVGGIIKDEEIIQSLLPTTIVDLDKQTVQHTQVYHEYVRMRSYYMNLEIEKLIHADIGSPTETSAPPAGSMRDLKKSSSKDNTSTPSSSVDTNNNNVNNNNKETGGGGAQEALSPTTNLIKPLREPSPYIAKMLRETFSLAPAMRETFITQSMHLLLRKAILLIKYVEAESKNVTEPMLPVETIKQIRGVLEVNADADFLVVLGIAEKLSPGIYHFLDVDPLVMEEKIVELFDQWSLG